ncbi:MAG: Nif3-like dinuclear metal center hexameric protein [Planctomycetes bacterium]|nr:Nif3-like dinuclear metal center hexameric protein [Planctomycetota bacterium]
MVALRDLSTWCDLLLDPQRFRDYCPNGVQVEAAPTIRRLASAATASLTSCQAAVDAGADGLIVHHGILWGGDVRIVGMLAGRVRTLLAGGCSLLAYHLPLDAHPVHGNSAVALSLIGASNLGSFGERELGRWGELPEGCSADALAALLERGFAHGVIHCPAAGRAIRRIGVVTGAGQGYLAAAAQAGCDALITGETAEQSWHEARELGCHLFACGHHATERHAVHRLAAMASRELGIEHVVLAEDNPL